MKSARLERLSRCNNNLKLKSWNNFRVFVLKLLESTEIPGRETIIKAVMSNDWNAVLEIADSYASATCETRSEHLLRNQFAAIIRKYPFPKGSVNVDPRGKALGIFLSSEHHCKLVNRRFALYQKLRSPHEQVLDYARSWIRYVLGDLSLPQIYSDCGFGPGASVGVTGDATNYARKILSKKWSVTPGAFYYAKSALLGDDHIHELLSKQTGRHFFSHGPVDFHQRFCERVSIIDYNKIAFVPKTARVDRTIAVEPLLNGFIQKGVDNFMRKRLKRVGIDLEDQSVNQRLAREGSRLSQTDAYATIDLSAASDSISTELCRFLLPPEWFDFLNSIRSRNYLLNGEKFPYEKFVTMGNGFCFPLETLIFASLCHAVAKERGVTPDFSVYGDDIILRSSLAGRLLDVLKVCGFRANTSKTFLSGPFRESCGADWFNGEDVRPITLDYAFDSVENIYKFSNLCRSKGVWEDIFYEANEFLVSLIPKDLLFTRPYKGQVDTALEVPYDVFMSSPFARFNVSINAWSWFELVKSAWQDNPVKRFAGYEVALITGALKGGTSPNPFTVRRKSRTKVRRISHSGATNLYLPVLIGI